MTLQQRLKELARTARLTAYSPGYTKMKEERPDISKALASIKKDIEEIIGKEINYEKYSECPSCVAPIMYQCTCSLGSLYVITKQRERLERYIGSKDA